MRFTDLGLSESVLQAIADAGYVEPTPIQEQAIPQVLMGRDVLGCAQTGTGKTASFTLPMIEALAAGRAKARMPRSLILTPTRELATQINEHFRIYGKYNKLTTALLIGGVSADEQIRKLDRGVDVLIATPGRLLDHFERGRILMTDIKILVIDESDRMLDMGFIPDVERIVKQLPKIRQTLFFSATMPSEIRRLADAFLTNPKEISVAPPASPAETVIQHLVVIGSDDKREALRRILRTDDVRNALVFCNRKRDVDILFRSLKKHGFSVAALHGDMDQFSRTKTLDSFRNNEIKVLVASDVAARGLDIEDLSHVFNFDVSTHAEDYVHRIGRTGRAGKEGHAFTFATPDESACVEAIVRLIGKEIPRYEIEGIETVDLEDNPGRHRRNRGRSSAKGRGRSKAGDAHPAQGPAQGAAKSAAKSGAKSAEGPKDAARPARDEQRFRRPRTSDKNASEHTDQEKNSTRRSRDANRKPRDDAKKDTPVVGMGDHVPAFMRRPS